MNDETFGYLCLILPAFATGYYEEHMDVITLGQLKAARAQVVVPFKPKCFVKAEKNPDPEVLKYLVKIYQRKWEGDMKKLKDGLYEETSRKLSTILTL